MTAGPGFAGVFKPTGRIIDCSAAQGWSQGPAGTTEPVELTTTSADAVNFGTATGLATGSVTVDGTVDINKLSFGSASGAITLSGGTLALGGSAPTISAQNTGKIFVRLGTDNALPATTVLTLDGGDGAGGGRFRELNLDGNNG